MNNLKCPPVAPMQAWRRRRHWSMPSSITLFSTLTHASIRFCLKSSTSCAFSARLAAPYFEVLWMYWGQGCSVDRNLEIHTLLDWEERMMLRMSVQTHLAEKITTSRIYKKMIMGCCKVYNQTASAAYRYNNPVYKLMTDKLKLMLINVLFDQILTLKFHKVV